MIFNSVPFGRLSTPDEIAKALLFFAFDTAATPPEWNCLWMAFSHKYRPLIPAGCGSRSRLVHVDERREKMTIRKVEIERRSMISSKPFEVVVAALKAAIGHPNMVEFAKATQGARTFAELESVVHRGLGSTGLMMFMELDLGAILRKETGLDTPKIMRFLIGNPLIMKEMAKHVPDAGSYAPVTILVDERPDGVHLAYDKMASFLAPYGNPYALAVARDLDSKIENLLRESAD
jgi:uncharacterized protein (DUF302 family)